MSFAFEKTEKNRVEVVSLVRQLVMSDIDRI